MARLRLRADSAHFFSSDFRADCLKLARLAGPVMLSRFGIVAMGLVDIAVVAQYSPAEAAYITLAWAPIGVMIVVGIGLIQSVQIMASRALGEGEPARAGLAWRRGLGQALIAGLLSIALAVAAPVFFRLTGQRPELAAGAAGPSLILGLSVAPHLLFLVGSFYFEALHRSRVPLYFMLAANVLNLALDLWFVFGGFGLPAMGATGAAFATLGSRLFLAAGLFWAVWSARGPGIRGEASDDGRLGAHWAAGGSYALAYFFEVAAFNGMIVIAGWAGAQALAAYGVFINIMAFLFMGALGLSVATGVLVGRAYGAQDAAGMRRAFAAGMALTLGYTTIAGLATWAFAAPIVGVFTRDASLGAMITPLLALMALAIVPDGAQTTASLSLRADGDQIFPTASHLFAYIAVMIPCGVWLSHFERRGARGVVEAVVIGSLVSGLVLLGRALYRFRARRGEKRAQ